MSNVEFTSNAYWRIWRVPDDHRT